MVKQEGQGPRSPRESELTADVYSLAGEWATDTWKRDVSGFVARERRREHLGDDRTSSIITRALEFGNDELINPLDFAANLITRREDHGLLNGVSRRDVTRFLDTAAQLSIARIKLAMAVGEITEIYTGNYALDIEVGRLHPKTETTMPGAVLTQMKQLQKSIRPAPLTQTPR